MQYNLPLLKITGFIIFGLMGFNVIAQTNHAILDTNNVSALVSDDGRLFHNDYFSGGAYEVPAGSGNHLIFLGDFWMAGHDQNGDLHFSSTFGTRFRKDFYRGPFSTTDEYFDVEYTSKNTYAIWTVKREEIIYHIDNYNHPNYIAPDGIANWPGNGNTNVGEAAQLAPFIDLNNNQLYEPQLGEYPCIKGDMTTYTIINDDADQLNDTLGFEPLGVEVHMILYQFVENNFIDTTTFMNVRVINRGNYEYNDFKLAFYVDADIGFADDDFIGCDSTKNLMYSYNGSNLDPGGNGQPGYGTNPPALGVVSLNYEMEYSGFAGFRPYWPSITPVPASSYWGVMNGIWPDSTVWTYGGNGHGGSTPTNYLYPGNPYTGSGWSELNTDGQGTSNGPTDRRQFMSLESVNLMPGDELSYDFAIITSRAGDHLRNVQGVIDLADSVQLYYDNQIVNANCQEQGTGVQDNIVVETVNYKSMFEIVRVDGEGNMGNSVDIHPSSEADILTYNSVDRIKYQRGKGPIDAKLTDTVNHALGYFVLKFNDYGDVDTASWTVYRYDNAGGTLLDSVESSSTISVGNEQVIPQWNISIRVKQEHYPCADIYAPTCPERDKLAKPIGSSMEFDDSTKIWLTGVKHNNGFSPMNWIMSGDFNPDYFTPAVTLNDPGCYGANFYDINNLYTEMNEGIIAPGKLARYNGCGFNPIQFPGYPVASLGDYSVTNNTDQPTVFHPSVDIVFTSDKSKWTRCAVIELNDDENTSLNNGKPGMLRQSPSIDKEGRQLGDVGYVDSEAGRNGTQPLGMGWFPGYAIDVETGRRLNIAYCENSTLPNANGTDMQWNPTSELFDTNGNPVFGGQHTIYVFGGEKFNMPNYDEGNFVYDNLSAQSPSEFRNVYGNLSWVMQPLLEDGENLNSTDVRVKARINKEFKSRVLTDLNDSRPMFEWEVIPYNQISIPQSSPNATGMNVILYPNPSNGTFTVTWDEQEVSSINIYSFQGGVVSRTQVENESKEKVINVNGLKSGVYLVQVGSEVKKLVISE